MFLGLGLSFAAAVLEACLAGRAATATGSTAVALLALAGGHGVGLSGALRKALGFALVEVSKGHVAGLLADLQDVLVEAWAVAVPPQLAWAAGTALAATLAAVGLALARCCGRRHQH
mmetsp:Transcript_40461/g.86154  ORF Transcript_40461/g.86154 Transcript_40461/m.86154 type:complete len:117 (-) Transcript_40461:11-361(-)